MIDITVETITNLFQSFMFIGFLVLFFDKTANQKYQIFGFSLFVLLMFLALNYFTYADLYFNLMDTVTYIILMELYSLIFLKGNKFLRIIMPIIAFLINTIISYLFGYIISFFTGQDFILLATESSIYRYFCIVVINITNLFVYWLIIKFSSKKISITKFSDFTAFVIIPILSMIIIYATMFIVSLTKFQADILIYLIVICICMIAIAIIVWLMMSRISKDNEIKTKLLLTQQREKLYETNILNANEQIEKIIKIKHDMKNNLMCINELIDKHDYVQAKLLCDDKSEKLSGVYTPVNTGNSLLNAVINVELEKASTDNIFFSVKIYDELLEFRKSSDIVSIIGNMCDNAIEYLQNINDIPKKMVLTIERHNSYIIITCRNRILKSVLKGNPQFVSTKSDKEFHGRGVDILRKTSQKYNGDLKVYEKDNWYYVSVILKIQSLPEYI